MDDTQKQNDDKPEATSGDGAAAGSQQPEAKPKADKPEAADKQDKPKPDEAAKADKPKAEAKADTDKPKPEAKQDKPKSDEAAKTDKPQAETKADTDKPKPDAKQGDDAKPEPKADADKPKPESKQGGDAKAEKPKTEGKANAEKPKQGSDARRGDGGARPRGGDRPQGRGQRSDSRPGADPTKRTSAPGGGPPRSGGHRGHRQGGREDHGLIEHVVKIRRVSKVVKGGRNMRFSTLVVVGDGKGQVGVALGRSTTIVEAIRKGSDRARRNMVKVPRQGTTVPHAVTSKYAATKVILKPASPGTGIIAGGSVRSVLEAAGIADILTKRLGSSNTINTVMATLAGLKSMLSPEVELEKRYGRSFTTKEETPDESQSGDKELKSAYHASAEPDNEPSATAS